MLDLLIVLYLIPSFSLAVITFHDTSGLANDYYPPALAYIPLAVIASLVGLCWPVMVCIRVMRILFP